MSETRNTIIFLCVMILVCLSGGALGYLGAQSLNAGADQSPGAVLVFPSPFLDNGQGTPIGSVAMPPTENPTDVQSTAIYGTQIAATVQAMADVALFRDHLAFSSTEEETDKDTISNTKDGLVLTILKSGGSKLWTTVAEGMPADVDASVTAQGLPAGPCDQWSYDLTVRQSSPYDGQPHHPFYNLRLISDQTWYFTWYAGNQFENRVLAYGALPTPVDMFQPNTLRIVAVGSHFDLYINGQQVGSADDPNGPTFPVNAVGVSVDTCSGSVSARFTDMIVKRPA